MISNRKFGILCSMPGLIALGILMLYPLAFNLYVSFTRYDNIRPVVFNGLKNYQNILHSSDFYLSLRVSIIYSLGTTFLTVVIALILAHSLSGVKKFGPLFRVVTILPWAAPLVISGLMWKWILSKDLGIINYVLGLFGVERIGFLLDPNMALISGILAATWANIPFATILILAGLEGIPGELHEAAKIDGADNIQRFWYVSMALNKPQVLVAGLITWMFTFRTPDLFASLTAGGPGKATYHIGLFLQDMVYRYMDFGKGGAISLLMFILVAVPSAIILYKGVLKQ